MAMPRKKDGLAVEQDLRATSLDGAEADGVVYFVSAARQHHIVELGMVRRPQLEFGGKVKLRVAVGAGHELLTDSRFRDFQSDLLLGRRGRLSAPTRTLPGSNLWRVELRSPG